MRRLLAVLVPLALLAACGDDDAAEETTTTVVGGTPDEGTAEPTEDSTEEAGSAPDTSLPETTVPTDAPAGDGPADGSEDGEGLGDALLVSDLTAAAEVPGPGDEGATGRFEAELSEGRLCVDMSVTGLGAPVVGAHLHDGAAGIAGPIIVDIGTPPSPDARPVRWDDACTDVADDVIQRLAGSPETVYVNVHTSAHPDGAVRGQLSVVSVFDRTLDS